MDFAVIADIVGSRKLLSRNDAQLSIERAIAEVARDVPVAIRPLEPTVGDEFQGIFRELDDVLTSLLLLQLKLPPGVRCRFGIGWGPVHGVESSLKASIEDGPGWWAAREAIDRVHHFEESKGSPARTWMVASESASGQASELVAIVNAYLLARDHIVGGISDRGRRLAYGWWLGRSQESMAAEEGITQSAVSQGLSRAGASPLFQGLREMSAHAARRNR